MTIVKYLKGVDFWKKMDAKKGKLRLDFHMFLLKEALLSLGSSKSFFSILYLNQALVH